MDVLFVGGVTAWLGVGPGLYAVAAALLGTLGFWTWAAWTLTYIGKPS